VVSPRALVFIYDSSYSKHNALAKKHQNCQVFGSSMLEMHDTVVGSFIRNWNWCNQYVWWYDFFIYSFQSNCLRML